MGFVNTTKKPFLKNFLSVNDKTIIIKDKLNKKLIKT